LKSNLSLGTGFIAVVFASSQFDGSSKPHQICVFGAPNTTYFGVNWQ
jgi:hypothetical protein